MKRLALDATIPLSECNETFTQAILESIPGPHILLDQDLRVVAFNEEASKLLACDHATLAGQPISTWFAPPADAHAENAGPQRQRWTADVVTGSGQLLAVELSRSVIQSALGPRYLVGVQECVAPSVEGRVPLTQDMPSRNVLASVSDAVLISDAGGSVVFCNRAARLLLDRSEHSLLGQRLSDVLQFRDPRHREQLEASHYQVMSNGGVSHLNHSAQLLRRKTEAVCVDGKLVALEEANGEISGCAVIMRDLSTEQRMQALISFKASHDELTGLLNRREFEHRLHELLLRNDSTRQAGSVLVIDLDRFKLVNDSHGHMAGDLLLRQLGDTLLAEVRGNDTLARIGGDRFAVLSPGCDARNAREMAENLHTAMAVFRFPWEGRLIQVGVSIGVVTIDAQMLGPGDVVTAADAALALAKENGRDRIVVYQAEGAEEQRRRGEVLWASRIREALDADRLRLYCQPILPLDGPVEGRWGCEVLVRMLDEHDRLIPPMAFLPAAERYDLMPQVDRWVINAVIEHWRSQPQIFAQIDKCNINLSGQSLAHRGFLEFVLDAFERNGFPPSMACFEITETAVIADMANAQRLIRELSARGCRFALDDFGSGLSSFTYLKHLPVDYLKIDGSFVQDMLNDPMDAAMVRAIAEVGRALGLKTIAEFVDNEATIAELRRADVDCAQGYGIQRPFALQRLMDYRPHALGE